MVCPSQQRDRVPGKAQINARPCQPPTHQPAGMQRASCQADTEHNHNQRVTNSAVTTYKSSGGHSCPRATEVYRPSVIK